MQPYTRKAIFINNAAMHEGREVELQGWIMNKRSGKGIIFIILRDGSGLIQCVLTENQVPAELFNQVSAAGLETSVYLKGKVVKDEKQIGGYEIQVSDGKIYQKTDDYPIAKKEHGVDFLMDQRHLWLRSRRQWAAMRVRNCIIFSIHSFFQGKGFVQMDSPIFTGNAVEGTSTLFETNFFDKPAYLSQSGQLYGEAMAMAMGLIYTFGPTFRAEKSKTRRHLSEFWMIEPEMAFYDNDMNMDLIEEMIRFIVTEVLDKCKFELSALERNTDKLEKIVQPFPRITYDDAVKILKGEKEVNGLNAIKLLESDLIKVKEKIDQNESEIREKEEKLSSQNISKGQRSFYEEAVRKLKVEVKDLEEQQRNIPQWLESAKNFEYGNDFGGSDETVITRMFDIPVMVYNWPKEVKAFYMKEAENNPNLVKGVDVLAPEGFGEIVGGGERETDLQKLVDSINRHQLPMSVFEWYLDLRKFGSVPHAGFGLGLERFVCWMCNLDHVRESIPFPRMMGRLFP